MRLFLMVLVNARLLAMWLVEAIGAVAPLRLSFPPYTSVSPRGAVVLPEADTTRVDRGVSQVTPAHRRGYSRWLRWHGTGPNLRRSSDPVQVRQ